MGWLPPELFITELMPPNCPLGETPCLYAFILVNAGTFPAGSSALAVAEDTPKVKLA